MGRRGMRFERYGERPHPPPPKKNIAGRTRFRKICQLVRIEYDYIAYTSLFGGLQSLRGAQGHNGWGVTEEGGFGLMRRH